MKITKAEGCCCGKPCAECFIEHLCNCLLPAVSCPADAHVCFFEGSGCACHWCSAGPWPPSDGGCDCTPVPLSNNSMQDAL